MSEETPTSARKTARKAVAKKSKIKNYVLQNEDGTVVNLISTGETSSSILLSEASKEITTIKIKGEDVVVTAGDYQFLQNTDDEEWKGVPVADVLTAIELSK